MKKNNKEIKNINEFNKQSNIIYKRVFANNLLQQNSILFFYYDCINETQRYEINRLYHDGVKATRIMNKTSTTWLSDIKYKELKNIFENNTIVFSLKDNKKYFSNTLYNEIKKIPNIYFIGSWTNQKYYRPSEFEHILKLVEIENKNLKHIEVINYLNSINNSVINTTKFLVKK